MKKQIYDIYILLSQEISQWINPRGTSRCIINTRIYIYSNLIIFGLQTDKLYYLLLNWTFYIFFSLSNKHFRYIVTNFDIHNTVMYGVFIDGSKTSHCYCSVVSFIDGTRGLVVGTFLAQMVFIQTGQYKINFIAHNNITFYRNRCRQ